LPRLAQKLVRPALVSESRNAARPPQPECLLQR
jgi:hypothetical protein